MSVTIIILSIGITSAICTSFIASVLHKMNWHKSVKKSEWSSVNMFLSSFYQFNYRFYSSFSFLRELMMDTFVVSLIFKFLVCEPDHLQIICIIGSFILTCIFRLICQLVVYSKFYDEELVK